MPDDGFAAKSRRDVLWPERNEAEIEERPVNETLSEVVGRNLARRSFLKGTALAVPVLMAPTLFLGRDAEAAFQDGLTFDPISPQTVDAIVVPNEYLHNVVIRWGDPLFNGAPAFDPANQSPAAQRQQFGFNNDFLGFFPLDSKGHDHDRGRGHDHHDKDDRALLVVNHEYTTGGDMFANYQPGVNKEQADIELAGHGGTVVEIERKNNGAWTYIKGSKYNRRITAETPMRITGPAAGHALLRTSADPAGKTVLGMLNNCSGGKTPWGTWLTCEENFDQYFANNNSVSDATIKAAHARYTITGGATGRKWENFYSRFDTTKEPNEPFRFGWVVEIDPYDPKFQPRKRTALGRTKHEAATTVISKTGKAVVYSGDDNRFDYLYKFVSKNKFKKNDRDDNLRLLDEGTLYVAKFNDDGTGTWIPLTTSNPALSGFSSQAEILIKTRLAGDAVGATAMDRPEDVEVNPANNKVYAVMTNNSNRTLARADKANPRVPNLNGHILEITEHKDDHAATSFTWNIFILCGNPTLNLKTSKADLVPGLPSNATFFAGFSDASKLGHVACPDNIAFDRKGNLWIATDGQPGATDIGRPNDAIHAVPTAGPDRGYLRQFLSGPKGSELCGPEFTDDNETLFCAIQHPGEDGGVATPTSHWPDGGSAIPRPSVVAVRHGKGLKVGQSLKSLSRNDHDHDDDHGHKGKGKDKDKDKDHKFM